MKTSAYIYLAVGCGLIGVLLTYGMLVVCLYLGVDISRNLWVITIPIILAIVLNITLIEVFSRRMKK